MVAETGNNTNHNSFEAFRKMRDSYLENMSKLMIDAVNSEEYAQMTGALLTNYLTLLEPFREAMDKTIHMALEQVSLPSREQVTALAERFTNLEMRLDDLDAKLDRIIELCSIARAPAAAVASSAKRAAPTETKASHHTSSRKP